ncbi:cell division protein FtsK [Actinocrinis puniceicyclus]|uniref:Cell division protein FtsK n=1 Tax=Actinocrinis puniceicyclus TaxID=977794 RepID=A0A8J8B980_9ACTN|nr:FtsK/SpoIIIE domain-containing protein [Actinocrinis puniceicyclus]MBS2961552.1 cell division protein FtsK [Actinocrinis puniceicyclus]
MRLSVTAIGQRARHQVVLGAAPDAPIAEVAERIAEAAGESAHELFLGGRRLDPRGELAATGLREGTVLGLGAPGPEPGARPGDGPALIELHIVSGPGAGTVAALALGSYPIGSSERCVVRVEGAPAHAATLTVAADGCVVVTPYEQTRLVRVVPPQPAGAPGDGDAQDKTAAAEYWEEHADLAVADSLLRWTAPSVADAAVQPAPDGSGIDFNRPPRILEPLPRTRFRLPQRPNPPGRRPFPTVLLILPVLMGVGMVFLLHSKYYLFFVLFTPMFAVVNWFNDMRTGRKDYRRRSAQYAVAHAETIEEITAAVAGERAVRAAVAPDPAAALLTAAGPGRRLWERRRCDADHLVLRIGTVDQPSLLDVDDPNQTDPLRRDTRWNVPSIPIGIALPDVGVVGVAAEPGRARPLAWWLLAQTAVLHSPRDVRFVVLTDAGAAQDWEWIRWLPHARSPIGSPPAMVGNDPETVAHRVSELVSVVKRRIQARGASLSAAMFADPDVVVLVDGARRLREVPGLVQVLAEGPAVRVFSICLDREVRLLPEEAGVVVVDEPAGLTLRQKDQPEVTEIRPDLVDCAWAERVARSLAPLRDVSPVDGGALPSAVRLLDLLELSDPDGEQIAARWVRRPASTAAVIGTGYDGTLAVDLVRDGPHALIAGTTGSGKSELLQTLVASLAVANRPDELTFLLVDYKGGSAFRDCVELPHTLGMVTDLDGHLVERALESLAAELRRREKLLAEHGVKDHPEYQAARRRDPALPPLPRLVLVVDEFATLVREVPAFVAGVVSIAQRGRSLGLHLVLATQRPAGVVSADIKANTNLRIALRVTDPVESHDVIDTNDAAAIPPSVPGRALVRLAHRAVAPFQTGYAGAPRERTEDGSAGVATPPRPDTWAVAVPWPKLGRAFQPPETETVADGGDHTDLAALVRAVREAARQLEIEPQQAPWLPALPDVITLGELPRLGAAPGRSLAPVVYGLEDLPAEQARRPLALDLETFSHLYVVGATRSGRSQTIRSIAGALAERHSTSDVHMYGIDAAGGALSVLTELPHTGAVAQRADLDRVDRLLTRLGLELTRRQSLLAEHDSTNLAELRATMPPGPRPAHTLLFIDGWEALYAAVNEYDNGRLVDEVTRLLREGAAAGIHLVIAGDRVLLSGRMGSLNENRLLLRMTDRSDYMLIGLAFAELPTVVPPGRAWLSGSLTEAQIALLAADPSGQAQAEALRAIGERARKRDEHVGVGSRPLAIGSLPSELDFADAYALVTERRPLLALLGIGGDDTGPVMVDFAGRGNVFMVVGPPGSGRSTVLSTFAVSALAADTAVLAVAARESPLRRLAAHPRARVLTSVLATPEDARAALEELGGGPAVVLLDDADLMAQMPPLEPFLRELIATGRDRGLALACAGTSETFVSALIGWIGEARRSRQGVLLSPQSVAEGDLVGARIPVSLLRKPIRPGRAYTADPVTGGLAAIALPLTVLKE